MAHALQRAPFFLIMYVALMQLRFAQLKLP
jgi:hypothetical protein